jgi:hypothetical protein
MALSAAFTPAEYTDSSDRNPDALSRSLHAYAGALRIALDDSLHLGEMRRLKARLKTRRLPPAVGGWPQLSSHRTIEEGSRLCRCPQAASFSQARRKKTSRRPSHNLLTRSTSSCHGSRSRGASECAHPQNRFTGKSKTPTRGVFGGRLRPGTRTPCIALPLAFPGGPGTAAGLRRGCRQQTAASPSSARIRRTARSAPVVESAFRSVLPSRLARQIQRFAPPADSAGACRNSDLRNC